MGGLAGHGRVAPDPEDVVDELKREPEPLAERAGVRRRPPASPVADSDPERARAAQQRRRSSRAPCPCTPPGSRRRATRTRGRPSARRRAPARRRRAARSASPARGPPPARRTSNASVSIASPARIAGPDAEHRPGGRAMAAQPVAVDDVVVQQRVVVHELDRDGRRQRRAGSCRRRPRPRAARASAGAPCRPARSRASPCSSHQPRWYSAMQPHRRAAACRPRARSAASTSRRGPSVSTAPVRARCGHRRAASTPAVQVPTWQSSSTPSASGTSTAAEKYVVTR